MNKTDLPITATSVKVRATRLPRNGVAAYADLVLNHCYCVRDYRVVVIGGRVLVRGPNRKILTKCNRCSRRNAFDANFCANCGVKLAGEGAVLPEPPPTDHNGEICRLFDLTFPTINDLRLHIEGAVLAEMERVHPGLIASIVRAQREEEEAKPKSKANAAVKVEA